MTIKVNLQLDSRQNNFLSVNKPKPYCTTGARSVILHFNYIAAAAAAAKLSAVIPTVIIM